MASSTTTSPCFFSFFCDMAPFIRVQIYSSHHRRDDLMLLDFFLFSFCISIYLIHSSCVACTGGQGDRQYRDILVVRHCLCTITVITIFIHVLPNSYSYLTIIFPRRQPEIALKMSIQSPGLRESFMSSAFSASRTSPCSRSHCLTVPLRHPTWRGGVDHPPSRQSATLDTDVSVISPSGLYRRTSSADVAS